MTQRSRIRLLCDVMLTKKLSHIDHKVKPYRPFSFAVAPGRPAGSPLIISIDICIYSVHIDRYNKLDNGLGISTKWSEHKIAHFVLQQSSPKHHVLSFMLVLMRLYGHVVDKISVVNRRFCVLNRTHSAYVFVYFRLYLCIFVARFAYKQWLQISHFLPQQPLAKRRSTKTLKIIPPTDAHVWVRFLLGNTTRKSGSTHFLADCAQRNALLEHKNVRFFVERKISNKTLFFRAK